jgi:hypothetical protein
MDGIGGMQKNGGCAGGIKSSNNFLGNDGAFAYTAHNYPTSTVCQGLNYFFKAFQLSAQALYGFRLHLNGSQRRFPNINFLFQAVKISRLQLSKTETLVRSFLTF